MNRIYDRDYQKLALQIANESGYEKIIRNGVYCMFSGPNYETVAELKMVQVVRSFFFTLYYYPM